MHKKNIIYLILVSSVILFGIFVFVKSTSSYQCTQSGTHIEKTFFKVTCSGEYIAENGEVGTRQFSTSTGFPLVVLMLMIITSLFYAGDITTKFEPLYSALCQKDIRKESMFLSTLLFFYFLILINIINLSFYAFGNMIRIIIISIGLTLPIGFSIFSGKKYLNSSPSKIIYKMPISALATSFILSIILEIYFIIIKAESAVFWLLNSLYYIIGITAFSFLLSIGLYQFNKTKNKILKYFLYFLLILPYVFVIFEITS